MPKSDYAQQELLHLTLSPVSEDGSLEDELLGDEELLNESRYESQFANFASQPVEAIQPAALLYSERSNPALAPHPSSDTFNHSETAEPLDASSLATILDMLAVIASIEELMLLESLTEVQKRQVWSATPEAVRHRLKQIRETNTAVPSASPTWENLNPSSSRNQSNLRKGNQVVLVAHPKLTSAELIAIWNVIEVHADYVRIHAENLGFRNYPVKWMMIYA